MLWVVVAGTLRFFRSASQKCDGCYKVLGLTARLCSSSFMLEPFYHLKSLLCQRTCAEISCLRVIAPDLHERKSEEHLSTRTLFSWPVWKRVNPNQYTSLAGEAMQYLILQVALFLLFFAVCACREAFPHVCYFISCFLVPSLSDSLPFSVTGFKNGSNPSLLPSQRKSTITLLYWVNAFSHTCSWMGDYLNI